jgi:hypothetical protein
MNYTGIDYHKRYSVARTLNGRGRLLKQACIDHNAPEAFAAYFGALDGPSEAVIEACWNWATLYDLLKDTPGVAKVVRSRPSQRRQTLILDNTSSNRVKTGDLKGAWRVCNGVRNNSLIQFRDSI